MSSTLTVCLPLLSIALYLYECHHDLYGPRVFMNKHWLYIEYTVAVIINACNEIVVHVLCKVAMIKHVISMFYWVNTVMVFKK